MRLIFVNHAHPDLSHVSGMRFGCFARVMAARGHEVVLVTSPLPGEHASGLDASSVRSRLANHDWRLPLTMSVPPRNRRLNRVAIPRTVGRFVTLSRFVRHGGVHDEWTAAVRPLVGDLVSSFKPDAVWGTFGNTSNLALSQTLARAGGCPWVIDVKDNWSTFLRPGVRELMAWRFRDAAAYTANALHHRDAASRWLWQQRSRVIYSGVAEPFFSTTGPAEQGSTELTLIGSTYDGQSLRDFLRVVKEWANRLTPSDRNALKFVYAGSDHERVSRLVNDSSLPCEVEVMRQLRVDELALRCKRSFANCYIWAKFTFHQKLLELLACGRPVICYPGEGQESTQLASLSSTVFSRCTKPAELHDALVAAWASRHTAAVDNQRQPWKWTDRADTLEAFLGEVARRQT